MCILRPESCQFAQRVVEMSSSKIHEACLEPLLTYLLLVSYSYHYMTRHRLELQKYFGYFKSLQLFNLFYNI